MFDNSPTVSEYSHEELLLVISSLPEGYRIVFNLFAVEGYKHKEIAEMCNIDVSTSKSQYSRAKKLIQKRLIDLKNQSLTISKSNER